MHEASGGPSTFWETRLDVPDYILADPAVETVFVSPTLKGIPKNPLAVFVLVKVPPGGETSVHTHPGPEFIYRLSGGIDYQGYQNDIFGMLQMTNGDKEYRLPHRSKIGIHQEEQSRFYRGFSLTYPNPSHRRHFPTTPV